MKALIDPRSDRVVQLHATGFPVAPPLLFVDVPLGVDVVPDAWRYRNGAFVAPPPPIAPETVGEAAARQLRERSGSLGLVRLLARRFAMTEQELIDAVKAELP